MPDVLIARLAGFQARDGTDALPGLRPPDWLDGAAGAFGGVEGCRAAGAAPGGGGAAAAEPEAEAGLGGPDGVGLEYAIVAVTCSLLWQRGLSGGDLVLAGESAEDLFSEDPVLGE